MTWHAYYDGKDTIIEFENIILIYEDSDISQLSKNEIFKLKDNDSRKLIYNCYSLTIIKHKSIKKYHNLSVKQLYINEKIARLQQPINLSFKDLYESLKTTEPLCIKSNTLFSKKSSTEAISFVTNFVRIDLANSNINDREFSKIVDLLSHQNNLEGAIFKNNKLTYLLGKAIVKF